MIKATKATLKKLQNWSFDNFVRASTLLEWTIRSAESFECHGDPNTVIKSAYTPDCLYVRADESDKPVFRGLNTRYPKLIEVSFTLGLNEVRILDINKLVKAMQADA